MAGFLRTKAREAMTASQKQEPNMPQRNGGHPSETPVNAGVDVTMPQLLLQNCQKWPDRVWMRKKDKGIWNEYTYNYCYEQIKYFSMGLASLGLLCGDKVAILGDNDPHWFWAELAAQAAGGAVAGVFSSSSPTEVKYIVELCDATFVIAQDQEQVDKVLSIMDQLPLVRKVIYWDSKGMRGYDDPVLLSFEKVVALGRECAEKTPHLFQDSIAQGNAQDLAIMVCTSGTTGLPKAAMVTYAGLYSSMQVSMSMYEVRETDDWVSYVLPGYILEQAMGLFTSLDRGSRLNFVESQTTVQENIREISPPIIFYPSRLWEEMASSIQNSMTESSFLDRLAYRVCLPVGYRKADAHFDGRELGPFWKLMYRLCSLILFNPIRDRHGLLNVRSAFTGGAALGPDIFRLITATGVDLRQTYGMSEMGISQHSSGNIKVDSVGIVNPGTIVRILSDGEILAKGKVTTTGYYKNPEATQKAFAGGWYHTGDAGMIDDDGHLFYLDRMEYMKELADGTKYAPQYLESRLKFSPFINNVFVVGDKTKPFVGLVVNIDFDNVCNWAEKRRIPYTTFADLSQKPEVTGLVRKEVEKVNERLPEGLRVRRFVNTPKAFDPDEAELTRTMKLRRGFMEDKYRDLIVAMYGEDEEVMMETKVVYRDGRTGALSTKLKVIRV
jgi:long-chain acyl-CoA synthetase